MLRVVFVLCSVFSLFVVLEVDGRSSWARGLTRIQNNIVSRVDDPIRRLKTASSLTSVYVGSTGIWWRSGVIAAISQMEQGKKEEAMETLNIAITTLTVFDITAATVSPIASELIYQLVKHKGQFPKTVNGFTQYNKAVAERMVVGTADDVDDIIDGAHSWRKQIGNFFDTEVTAFMKNTQTFDDLVTSLNNAKGWAKGLTWLDTISGPLFDAANVAFCGWQLHNAIHDETSPPEVKSLNIASASIGVASGAVGVTAFVVGALATAGSTLAAVAGPVGAIIGCILSLASIIIDLINSFNPYGKIKDHLETIQKLKEGSLQYLENEVNITTQVTRAFIQDTGFKTIYQINQGNLILEMRGKTYQPILGVTDTTNPTIVFDATNTPGEEDGYLTMGMNRMFDKSKYANILWKPTGIVPLGYDFYGTLVKPTGKGVTVVASTIMVAEQFWIRGVDIDTRVENDEEEGNPDNVVIGEMTGLATLTDLIRVHTGAGDDLLQVTGLICNWWTYNQNCLFATLGTGINTLSFQGMDPDRIRFPTRLYQESEHKVLVGIHYDMRGGTTTPGSEIHLRMKDSESSTQVNDYNIGFVDDVNVFDGSPLNDTIVMGDEKSCIVKNDGGYNRYVIFLHNEHDFTHTIIDNSETIGKIFLVWRGRLTDENLDNSLRDVAYDQETQTLVVFMRTGASEEYKKHTFIGRIIIKRTKPGDVKEMQLSLVRRKQSDVGCPEVPLLDDANLECRMTYTLGHKSINRGISSNHRYNLQLGWNVKDRPVPSVPFHYEIDTDIEANPIPDLCGDFIITLGFIGHLTSEPRQFSLRLPKNYFLAVDDDIEDLLRSYSAHITIYYLKPGKKLIYQIRYSSRPGEFNKRSVELHVPEAKRIVFGPNGNRQLLLDLKHDDRPAVNLRSEYFGLNSRPVDEYNFAKDYTDRGTKPKQIVLGPPSETPSERQWKMTLGRARTYNSRYGRQVTGNYAENALIVGETLWAYLSREGNNVKILFVPTKRGNKWKVAVKKGRRRIHVVVVEGANTLAYHEKLFRSNLYDLENGARERFNLYEVWKQKMATLESDIASEANICT